MVNKTIYRLSDFTRFRLSRLIKWILFIVLLSIVLAVAYKTSPVLALFQVPALFVKSLPLIGQLIFAVIFGAIQILGIFWAMSRGGIDTYFPDDIQTRFSDVWGQDHVLERLRENLVFLEDPDSIEKMGGYVPSGILLWGPPGTGKTLMAEAMAGETGKPFVFVDPGAFQNMFFGVGILKVKSLFRKLRKLALRYGGVIVFFDEADSLGSRGSISSKGLPKNSLSNKVDSENSLSKLFDTSCHGNSFLNPTLMQQIVAQSVRESEAAAGQQVASGVFGGGGMGTLQALLTELSGLKKPRGFFNRIVRRTLGMKPKNPPKYRILVVMATNMPDALDEALLRPGRIDRMYRVGYPAKPGRIKTYKGYLNKITNNLSEDEVDKLATITPYASGAKIKDMVNEALIMAIRDGREIVTYSDVIKAKQLKDLGPSENVEYIERERHATAIHEACHAVTAYRKRKNMMIDIATIEKGSSYLGMVSSIPADDLFTSWKTDYEADILVSLASLAGEREFFDGDNSSGVSGDLESATTIASLMEGYWGMGSTISSHAATQRTATGTPGGGKPEEKGRQMRQALGDRIERNLVRLYDEVQILLRKNRKEVLSLAHALEIYKTLSGEDVAAVIDGKVGPLVDGRPYKIAANLKRIEEYHKAALIAHKNHENPKIAIPRFSKK